MKKREDESIDIKALLSKAYQYWPLFALSLFLSLGYAYLYIRYYTEPHYNVVSTILIKPNEKISGFQEIDLFRQDKKKANEMAILKSYEIAYKTLLQLEFSVSYFHKGQVRDVELYQSTPFKVIIDTSFKKQAYNVPVFINIISSNDFKLAIGNAGELNQTFSFGEPVKLENLSFTVVKLDENLQIADHYYFKLHDPANLAILYRNKLQVTNSGGKESSILELSTVGNNIQRECDYLNKLTEVYIQNGLEEKNQIASNTINFIDSQLASIAASLNNAETELESFRRNNKVMDISSAATSVFAKLDELESEKAVLLVKDKYYHYVLDYVSNNKDLSGVVAPSTMGIDDPLLNSLTLNLVELNREKSSLGRNTTGNNPFLNSLEIKIKNSKEALLENVKNIINGSRISIEDIEKRIVKLEKEVSNLPRNERDLVDIQRRFNLNDHLYNYLLEKKAESGIAKASNIPDNRIVERARSFNAFQVGPKTNMIYSNAILVGLSIPLGFLFLRSYFNNKIQSKKSIEERTDIPVIGIVGHNDNFSNLAVLKNPKSGIAESFRSIRINLQYLAPDKEKKIICITSSISGEGKTFTSINLASIVAMSGKKTILIGADLRKPKIFEDFGLDNSSGLSTYLAGKHKLEQIVFKTQVEHLDIISAGPVPPNPGELILSSRLNVLMDELKLRYDYIIIDTPPIGLVSDCFILMKYSDINLYIVRHKYTEIKLLDKVNGFVNDGKISNMSIIINDLYNNDSKYGYGYGYYDSFGYYEEKTKSEGFLNRIYKKIIKENNAS
ncbi:GumC family protein [Sporocytophaga myxococcoides]|uniref:GumC family protein n=1 Tax=Sporocytophaga myxococcoides TaxID=153721 RepID=UPI000414F9F2|nr:tyrosine-protein kinase [Sporocytophaga myxococcoides]